MEGGSFSRQFESTLYGRKRLDAFKNIDIQGVFPCQARLGRTCVCVPARVGSATREGTVIGKSLTSSTSEFEEWMAHSTFGVHTSSLWGRGLVNYKQL